MARRNVRAQEEDSGARDLIVEAQRRRALVRFRGQAGTPCGLVLTAEEDSEGNVTPLPEVVRRHQSRCNPCSLLASVALAALPDLAALSVEVPAGTSAASVASLRHQAWVSRQVEVNPEGTLAVTPCGLVAAGDEARAVAEAHAADCDDCQA